MIGKVVMEISNSEMRAAVQYYLNSDLFFSKHKVKVTEIVGRSNGRYTIRLQGDADPDFVEPEKVEPPATHAAAGTGDYRWHWKLETALTEEESQLVIGAIPLQALPDGDDK